MQQNENPTLIKIGARMGWMLIGPILFALFAIFIIQTGQGWLTALDFGFFVVIAGLIMARWLEFRCGSPETADGQPAAPEHLQRYILAVLGVGLAVWVIANILGNYVLVP